MENTFCYRVCNMGHINRIGETDDRSMPADWFKCSECGRRLQESQALTALCRRIDGQNFELVECVMNEHTMRVKGGGLVLEGPIENALIVTFPEVQMQAIARSDESFIENIIDTIKGAGWDGEVVVASDSMKFAKFKLADQ